MSQKTESFVLKCSLQNSEDLLGSLKLPTTASSTILLGKPSLCEKGYPTSKILSDSYQLSLLAMQLTKLYLIIQTSFEQTTNQS